MQGLSKTEMGIISQLEFSKRYFFTTEDIDRQVSDRMQRYNIIKNLVKKRRIVKINRKKYYLVPIKAKSGSWSEHSFIIADEICDGRDYFIGGWAAAHYWHLTDQIPGRTDVWTTRRQGKVTVLNSRFVFHRTTKKMTDVAVTEQIGDHLFKIIPKELSVKWIRQRQ
jgi:predicted transcriptional regulator of viral defense system